MELLKKNQIVRATIEGYSSEGAGVARYEGMVIFVQDAASGDVCDIHITKVGKSIAFGRIEELILPSPERIQPACGLIGCGGCDFRHITYDEELRFKRQRVVDAITRIGGLDIPVLPVIASKDISHYRNKAVFNVGTKDGRPVMGFYRERSHDIVPAENCLIQSHAICAAAKAVLGWMMENNISAYNEATHTGLVRHVFVRSSIDGKSLLSLGINDENLPTKSRFVTAVRSAVPEVNGILLNVNTDRGNSVLGKKFKLLWGTNHLEDRMCGLKFNISPASFYQVNTPQAEKLYEKALELSDIGQNDTVLDLYCGIGTISLCFAKKAKKVIGVEIVSDAVENARENAKLNGLENAEFILGDAGMAAKLVHDTGEKINIVVVDPPRKGLAPDVIETIAALGPEKVVYISCDCATLARDLKLFSTLGYESGAIQPVDMFPRTRHVETVILMTRCGQNDK